MSLRKMLNSLIDNPLLPTPAEWVMLIEDCLVQIDEQYKTSFLNDETKEWIVLVRNYNGALTQYNDSLIGQLKRALRWLAQNKVGKDVFMDNKEAIKSNQDLVFIVYSHKNRNIMLDVKDFVINTLSFDAVNLDIADFTGSVWDAFVEKTETCTKAIIIMADDDKIVTDKAQYYQARQNVFIELGYMIHKCGLTNVTLMCTEQCTIPSDINGLIHVVYDTKDWKESLRKQLTRTNNK